MKIILCDLQLNLVQEWARVFETFTDIKPIQSDILRATKQADAFCSAGNSFGFMTGGVDLAFARYFGPTLQTEIQDKIKELPGKELPVGSAITVTTHDRNFPNFIYTPTMRVPMNISNKVNVYMAFRAILGVAQQHGFETIVCPGLGTATGLVSPKLCAKQMYRAYTDFISNYFPASLEEAMDLHIKLTEE